MRTIWLIALLSLAGSEALIVQWALLASERAPLGPVAFVALLAALLGANVALMALMRRRARGGALSVAMSRLFMMGSLGALFSGPLLLAAFTAIGTPLWLLDALSGSEPRGYTALVGGGGVALALGFGSIVWGFLVGQRRVVVENIQLPLPHLPPELEGLRIAHITDLHIGPQMRAPLLERLVDRVNALDPDLIVITGDIFDFDPAFIDEGCAGLARLEARHGVYAILGNHDVYTGADAVAAGLESHTKIRLLRDEVVCVEACGAHLHLIGIEDPGYGFRERAMESRVLPGLVQQVPDGAARMLLMHRPAYFPQVVSLGLPVALAGHTHGGQISLPPPAHHANISRLMTDWTRGLFRDGDTLMYVSRGLGVAGPPIRLNCPREISLHHLRRP